MIDTHCHLTDAKIAGEFEQIMEEARLAGVGKVILPAVDTMDSQRVLERVDGLRVFGLVGVHPEHAQGSDLKQVKKMILEAVGRKGVVGIGECGLDFYYDKERKTKQAQVDLLKTQVELALKLSLPVVLHNRDSGSEMVETLRSYEDLRAQLHCFDGSLELMSFGLSRDFYFSFCGNITYKNSEHLVEALKRVPLDRLLLETDSPYLAPLTRRGEVNKPANVRIIAGFVAEVLEKSMEEITNITSRNAERLFERLC